jgi:hypothetical protein
MYGCDRAVKQVPQHCVDAFGAPRLTWKNVPGLYFAGIPERPRDFAINAQAAYGDSDLSKDDFW